MPLVLSQLPTEVGRSVGVGFLVGLASYTGTATRMNETDVWIITNIKPGFLAPAIDPPMLYVNHSFLDSLQSLLDL